MTVENQELTSDVRIKLSTQDSIWLRRGESLGKSARSLISYSAYASAGAFILVGTAIVALAVLGTIEPTITQAPAMDPSLR